MRVLLNLLPVTTCGGRQNAANLWRAVSRFGEADSWLCVCRPEQGYEASATQSWQDVEVMDPGTYAERVWLENRTIPRLASRWKADVIFTPSDQKLTPVWKALIFVSVNLSGTKYPKHAHWRSHPFEFMRSQVIEDKRTPNQSFRHAAHHHRVWLG